ncbi:MAG: PrsW family intramembrane metalloprotease [Patescibacteria group bacterium]
MLDTPQELVMIALAGSLIPSVFWLLFWSRRDRFCPEPRTHLFSAFIFGGLAALFTLPTQSLVVTLFGTSTFLAMILFVSVEEYAKYIGAWFSSIQGNPYYNERIDPIIYLTTTALGFAALENILYFLQYLNNFNLDIATIEGGKRIIGATILHMVATGVVGVCLSLVFFKSKIIKFFGLIIGLLLAVIIHLGFNFLVTGESAHTVILAFAATWFLFMFIVIAIELLRAPSCPPEIDWNNYEF